jgi:hypothetical protein
VLPHHHGAPGHGRLCEVVAAAALQQGVPDECDLGDAGKFTVRVVVKG